jgi:hypothetical protein
MIGGLEDVCYSEGRNAHQSKVTLHFDNASTHTARTVIKQFGAVGVQENGAFAL